MTITAERIIEEAYKMLGNPNVNRCDTQMTNEEYHANKFFISRSAIMDFKKSAYTYWARHLNPDRPKKETTPAMQFGTAFHTLMLEPELFDKRYVMKPEPVFLKDVGREAYDKYKSLLEFFETCGSIVLSAIEWENLMAMREVFNANQNAVNLILDARIENSFFWQDKHSGLLLKARPDILHENMIVDLKTCADASPRAFQNSMVTGGYHVQGAMCRDAVEAIEGHRIDTVINICIETKYPHNMAIYIIDELAIDEGQFKYKNILLDMKNSIAENNFKDYGMQTISLPKWPFNG